MITAIGDVHQKIGAETARREADAMNNFPGIIGMKDILKLRNDQNEGWFTFS